jgi:hypothetical protein
MSLFPNNFTNGTQAGAMPTFTDTSSKQLGGVLTPPRSPTMEGSGNFGDMQQRLAQQGQPIQNKLPPQFQMNKNAGGNMNMNQMNMQLFSQPNHGMGMNMNMNPQLGGGGGAGGGFYTGASNAAPTSHDMDMLTLMRAKANLAKMEATFHAQREQEAMFSHELYGAATQNMNQFSGMPGVAGGVAKRSMDQVKGDFDREEDSLDEPKNKKHKKGKKPLDMPRRALSAYNIFFSEQRRQILEEIDAKEAGVDGAAAEGKPEGDKEEKAEDKKPEVLNRTFFPTRTKRPHRKVHGKIGLVSLARTVSKRWKELDSEKRTYYQGLAAEDKIRHKQAMLDYQEKKAAESMLEISTPKEQEEEMLAAAALPQMPNPSFQRQAMVEQYQQRILADMMGMGQQPAMMAASRAPRSEFEMMVEQRLNAFGSQPNAAAAYGAIQGMQGMQGMQGQPSNYGGLPQGGGSMYGMF